MSAGRPGPIAQAVMREIRIDLSISQDAPEFAYRGCGSLWYCDAFPLADVDIAYLHQDSMFRDWDCKTPRGEAAT